MKVPDDQVSDARVVSVRQLLGGVIAGFVILGGATVWGFVQQTAINDRQEQQDARRAVDLEAAAVAGCGSAAEVRDLLRAMVTDGGVASGTAGGEALIATATDADPADIAAYRAHLEEQLTPALTAIVNRLPDRRWDPEAGACVDVEVDP